MLIQFLLVAAMAISLVMTWRRVRERVIHPREAIGWSALWIAAAIIVLQPEVTTRVAHLFGVGRGVDFVLYAAVVILFLMVFRLFLQNQKIERAISDLVRHEALQDLDREKKL